MTDQCINCTLKGDWKGCKATECGHHENWGWKQLESENKQQAARIDELHGILMDLIESDEVAIYPGAIEQSGYGFDFAEWADKAKLALKNARGDVKQIQANTSQVNN